MRYKEWKLIEIHSSNQGTTKSLNKKQYKQQPDPCFSDQGINNLGKQT